MIRPIIESTQKDRNSIAARLPSQQRTTVGIRSGHRSAVETHLNALNADDAFTQTQHLALLAGTFGARLGAFDLPLPPYLMLLAHEARPLNTKVPNLGNRDAGGLVAAAGVATGVGGYKKRSGKIRNELDGIFQKSQDIGNRLLNFGSLDAWLLTEGIGETDGNLDAQLGAIRCLRLLLEAYEAGVAAWVTREVVAFTNTAVRPTFSLRAIDRILQLHLLTEPKNSKRLSRIVAYCFDEDDDGEEREKALELYCKVDDRLARQKSRDLVTDDLERIRAMYQRPIPKESWALTTAGRRHLAETIGRPASRIGKSKSVGLANGS